MTTCKAMRQLAAALLLISASSRPAAAQTLIEQLSFGQTGQVSTNGINVPGWQVFGEGQVPQLLSDKVVLTPLDPGHTRGAMWSEARTSHTEWVVDLSFRASGPDKGSGNLQIWYTKDGKNGIGAASLYTVENFDGLVIALDQYGGQGGSIRGFLNDGTSNYRSNSNLDSLAFGHCVYAFRNLGRPSRLQIRQQADNFEVIIEDHLCFASDKIKLPPSYSWGVTAGTADVPDSFEIYSFKASSLPSQQQQQQQQQQPPPVAQDVVGGSEYQARLQSLTDTINRIDRDLSSMRTDADHRHQEVSRGLLNHDTLSTLSALSEKLDRVERKLGMFESQMSTIDRTMKDSHLSLTEHLPKHVSSVISLHAPRMGMIVLIFVAVQIVIFGVYAIYKRRAKQGPKKYL